MIKAMIVEDQTVHSNKLIKLLNEFTDIITIVAVTKDIDDSVAAIIRFQPDLLFLDIQLGDLDNGGFQILNRLNEINFEIVFTTAHVDHNIEQIRNVGLDYMIKTYVIEELTDAIGKFLDKRDSTGSQNKVRELLEHLRIENVDEHIVWLRIENQKLPLKVCQIIYCETAKGESDRTVFHYLDLDNSSVRKIESNGLIGEWENHLSKYKCCRINRWCLANYNYISSYTPGDNELSLRHIDNKTFTLTRKGKRKLDELMRS